MIKQLYITRRNNMTLLNTLKQTSEDSIYFDKLNYDLLEEEHHNQKWNNIKYKPLNVQVLSDTEEWRLISGYSSIYYVSNLGRVHKRSYCVESGRFTKPSDITPKIKKNALEVTLTDPMTKLKTTVLLSTLVGQAFVLNGKRNSHFIHINGNPYDCRASNLKM